MYANTQIAEVARTMTNADNNDGGAIKVIDIAPFADRSKHSDAERKACAEQWNAAFSEVGFALVVGHGVDLQLIQDMRRGFRAFFEGFG